MFNRNPETGVPYGVTNNIPDWLWEEIDQWLPDDWDEIRTDLAWEVLKKNRESLTQEMVDEFWGGDDVQLDELDDFMSEFVVEFVEEMFPGEWQNVLENFDDSELRKSGEVEGVKLSLSYLGGAPLLWVVKSPRLVWCRPCSPCVPGGGDLDSPQEEGSGMQCYGLPEGWINE
jgi:hypothetical protein